MEIFKVLLLLTFCIDIIVNFFIINSQPAVWCKLSKYIYVFFKDKIASKLTALS